MNRLALSFSILIASTAVQAESSQIDPEFRAQRRIEMAKRNVDEISKALDLYYTDCGHYPDRLEDLYLPPGHCKQWGPDPYLKIGLLDPWGNRFEYLRHDLYSHSIRSLGRDGHEGGEGEDMDIVFDTREK